MPRKAQPVAVPTGRPYGSRADLARTEAALPLPATPAGPATASAPAPTAGGGMAAALQSLGQMTPLGQMQGGTDTTMSNVASPVSTMPPAPVDSAVARYLPILETAANMPNASWALKQFTRRLRAQTPASTDLGNPAQVQ